MAFQAILTLLSASAIFFLATLQQVDAELVADLSSASSSFSQQLYKQVASSGSNVIYSPYSIHSALTMTSTGARGDTLKEMRQVLGLTAMSDDDVRTAYHNLIVQLNSVEKVKLDTANAIFANPSYKVKDEFVDEIAAKFFATATNFDLTALNGPEAKINDYVSVKTHKMITKVLEPGSIDASTLMILINTIYFNGTWQLPFAKYLTRKQDFFQKKDARKQITMMHGEEFLPHKRDLTRNVDVVELPFKGNRFGLFIALPHDIEGINQLEGSLDNGVDDLFQGMTGRLLTLAIPKFKIETSLKLKPTLMAMGMKKAFIYGQANFTGISESGSFNVDDVIHKAVIDVMETGTVASAVTAVTMIKVMGFLFHQPPDRFIADHPFMYFLRDKQTGQILFQGKFSG